MQRQKAITAVIATIMLLMTTVALIGIFYVFSSGLATTTTSSGEQQSSQLVAQLSSCMQIGNIRGSQVTLENCGKGVIESKSVVATIGDIKLGANTNTIQEGNSSVVNITGLWNVPFGKHSLKISNGAAFALALVDVQPNSNGLFGFWNFEEGSGSIADDASGNGNVGTLLPAGSEPVWTSGRFGKGLQFDGADDYVDAGNNNTLDFGIGSFTISAWVKRGCVSCGMNAIAGRFSTSGYYVIFQDDNKIMFTTSANFVCPPGQLCIQVDAADRLISINTVTDTAWHFIAVTRTVYTQWNSTKKIYIDGLPALPYGLGLSEDGRRPENVGASADFWMGNSDTEFGSAYFNGIIDNVQIYNRSLSSAEILAQYNAVSSDEAVVMKQII